MRSRLSVLVGGVAFALLGSACSSVPARDAGRNGFLDRKWGGIHARGERYDATENQSEEELSAASARAVEKASELKLAWPLRQVSITSKFGRRSGNAHEGIDLRAGTGTPVYAAQAGQVLYSGSRIRGYGKLVVVRHGDGISTIYAHNSRLSVIRGQRVKQGQLLAYSGKTGHASGPHVHFEVRSGTQAIDPARVIAARAVAEPVSEGRTLASDTSARGSRGKRGRAPAAAAARRREDDSEVRRIASRQSTRIKRRLAMNPSRRSRSGQKHGASAVD